MWAAYLKDPRISTIFKAYDKREEGFVCSIDFTTSSRCPTQPTLHYEMNCLDWAKDI